MPVAEKLRENNVVALQADMTEYNAFADQFLGWAGNESAAIPFIAVLPAGKADHPIIFDTGVVRASDIVDALNRAGPSQIRQP